MRGPVRPIRQRLADGAKTAGGLVGAGMSRIMGSRNPKALGILFYHRIAPKYAGLPAPGLNVTPDRFRLQMEGLLERGFRFLSLRQAVDMHARAEQWPERSVVITFDDAFAGVHRFALPVLRSLDLPATVFAVTNYVGRTEPMHFDMWGLAHHRQAPDVAWRSMNWAECRDAEATGLVEIGCHTHAHQNYADDITAFEEDLRVAQTLFQEHLGGRRPLFAIPYGDARLGQVSVPMLEASRAAGLQCALTTTIGQVLPGQSAFGWPRLEVVDADNGATLGAKLEGWYDWMGRVKGAVHRVSPW